MNQTAERVNEDQYAQLSQQFWFCEVADATARWSDGYTVRHTAREAEAASYNKQKYLPGNVLFWSLTSFYARTESCWNRLDE